MAGLAVNVDHVATLRQARMAAYPDPADQTIPLPSAEGRDRGGDGLGYGPRREVPLKAVSAHGCGLDSRSV